MKKQIREDIKWFLLIVDAGIEAEVIAKSALRHKSIAAALPEILPKLVLKSSDTQSTRQVPIV